jgi:hypothetical protein
MDPLATRLSESRLGPLAAWLAGTALAVTLWVLVRHGLAVPASTDDFCNRLNALQGTALEATLASYTGWTGRLVTTAALYLTLRTVDLPHLSIVSAMLPALLAMACWFLSGAFGARHLVDRLAIAAFAFVALVIGLHRLLGQTLFWVTGGIVYLVPLVLVSAWLSMMARIAEGKRPVGGVMGALLLGLLAGNSIELAWAVLIVTGLAVLVHVRAQPQACRDAAAALAGALAGGIVLAVAPGNFHRATATERSFSLDAGYLAGEYVRMLREVLAAAPELVGATLVLVVLGFAVRPAVRVPHVAQRGLIASLLVLAALGSLAPVLAVPPQFAPRNGLFLLVLLFAAGLVMAIPPILATRYGTFAIATLAIAGALATSFRFVQETEAARVLQQNWVQRDALLRSAAAAGRLEVVLPRRPVWPPPTVHAIELGEDPARWDNKCVARYYGLSSVSAPPPK